MKYLKKMIAGFLAALTLSHLCLPFCAANLQGQSSVNRPLSGSVRSTAVNAGSMPNDVISVIVPLLGSDVFNFILDPNNMIKSSDAIETRFDGAEFGPGRVFFKNTDGDGAVTGYSMDSDEVKIYNKSSCPLLVTMTISTTKGSNYQLAKTSDFKDANDKLIKRPALYLALVNGVRSSPVLNQISGSPTEYQAKLKGWIEDPECYEVFWDGTSFQYRLKEDVEDEKLPYTSFYMTGAINQADWSGVTDVSYTVTWSVTKEAGPDENPIPDTDTPPSVIVLEPAVSLKDEVVLRYDHGWGAYEMETLQSFNYYTTSNYAASGKHSITPERADAVTFGADHPFVWETDPSNPAKKLAHIYATSDIYKAKGWTFQYSSAMPGAESPVEVPFDLMSASEDTNPQVSIASGASAAKVIGDEVNLKLNYGKGENAMSKVTGINYLTAAGASKFMPVDSKYLTVDGTNASIVVANRVLFEGSNWKMVFTDEADGSYEAPFVLRHPSVQVVNKDPSVTVDTQVGKMNQEAVMTFDLGSGSKYMTGVDRLEYTAKNGNTITLQNLTIKNNTITVKVVSSIYKGSNWKIVFVNEDDDAYTYASVDAPLLSPDAVSSDAPSIFVHQGAKLAYDTAKMTIYWGEGEEKVTKLKSLRYQSESGSTLGIALSNSNLSFDADTGQLSLVAFPMAFNGSNWRALLENDEGVTTEIYFDLKHETPYEDEIGDDPSITVTQAATAVGQEAVLTFDFGTGDKEMTKIKRLLYKSSSGSDLAMVLSNSNLKIDVENRTIRIKMISMMMSGSDWRFEFSNGDAHDAKVKEVAFNPKVVG